MTEEVLILNSDRGKLVRSEIVRGRLEEVLKKLLLDVIDEWSPNNSDLIVMRQVHEVRIKLPLTKELYDKLVKYNLRRANPNEAVAEIPIYIISYDNMWVGEDVYDNKIYVVAPYINDELKKELEELAIETTAESSSR
ncbi:MAG: DUF2286 domain-containing protein [Thermoprotei archaeon]|nr:MAG: DUF2286 domain-containing protein [Thermoprotei archaeon]